MLPIVYAPFPYLDLQRNKNRPLLVLGKSRYESNQLYIVAYITSKPSKLITDSDYVFSVTDPDFEKTGLTTDSIFRLGRIGCVEASSIVKEIGTIEGIVVNEVKAKLKTLFNL
jgi:mRNA interferase MazF